MKLLRTTIMAILGLAAPLLTLNDPKSHVLTTVGWVYIAVLIIGLILILVGQHQEDKVSEANNKKLANIEEALKNADLKYDPVDGQIKSTNFNIGNTIGGIVMQGHGNIVKGNHVS